MYGDRYRTNYVYTPRPPRVQKFDWLKDVTPEEEALMKSNEWDLEDTSLGPVEERYAQPALHLSDEKHQHALRMGREADRLASAHAAGGKVRAMRDHPHAAPGRLRTVRAVTPVLASRRGGAPASRGELCVRKPCVCAGVGRAAHAAQEGRQPR